MDKSAFLMLEELRGHKVVPVMSPAVQFSDRI